MLIVSAIGIWVRDFVLTLAGALKQPEAPGFVTLGLLIALLAGLIVYLSAVHRRTAALRWLNRTLAQGMNGKASGTDLSSLEARLKTETSAAERRALLTAWNEYRDTLVPHRAPDGDWALRNAIRPSVFFNVEDLRFGPGFWRIVPGLFVTVGLFLTFLGLISALHAMDLSADQVQASLRDLLTIASAKFIMSLTGLFCSIVFTVLLRIGMERVESGIHRVCGLLERNLPFVSMEALAEEQLAATREQREHFRMIGLELVAELGRPLREELPNAIASSISAAVAPLLENVGRAGTDGMGTIVKDLSEQFSSDVARALKDAGDRFTIAGDRIAQLAERMDQSTANVGTEIDAAVVRLAQAIDDLRGSMGATAATASGALTQGAEHLLAVMNQTLEGIRDNTSEGAKAMSAAAAQMSQAAEHFRTEIETASRQGATAAAAQMSTTGAQASESIASAGQSVRAALDQSAAAVLRQAESFATQSSERLLTPLQEIHKQLNAAVATLSEGNTAFRKLADGVQAGATATESAAGAFRSASASLVEAANPIRATSERIETSIRDLNASTKNAADVVTRSAETTAVSAQRTLAAAEQALGGHVKAIEASFANLDRMIRALKGQGDRIDEIDEKLGSAFELYNQNVQGALNVLAGHVRAMQSELGPALDTLRSVVEQAERFIPRSGSGR
jgi:methyl-accepting chemotaxis protein